MRGLPGWLRLLVRFNPLTYAVDGMRSLVIEPVLDGHVLVNQSLMLIAFDAVLLWVGVRALRRVIA